SNGRCPLLNPRAPRRACIGPNRLVRVEQSQEREPVHRSEPCPADVPPAQGSVGQYRPHAPAIAEIQIGASEWNTGTYPCVAIGLRPMLPFACGLSCRNKRTITDNEKRRPLCR